MTSTDALWRNDRDLCALRDQFAAAALTGLLAHPNAKEGASDSFAQWAYTYADAMMQRRTRPTADAPAPASTAP